MDKHLRDVTYFLSFCIEQYMNAKGLNEVEVIDTFTQYGVLDYLNEHFEVLHTQSRQWLIAEIDEFINKRLRNPIYRVILIWMLDVVYLICSQ